MATTEARQDQPLWKKVAFKHEWALRKWEINWSSDITGWPSPPTNSPKGDCGNGFWKTHFLSREVRIWAESSMDIKGKSLSSETAERSFTRTQWLEPFISTASIYWLFILWEILGKETVNYNNPSHHYSQLLCSCGWVSFSRCYKHSNQKQLGEEVYLPPISRSVHHWRKLGHELK